VTREINRRKCSSLMWGASKKVEFGITLNMNRRWIQWRKSGLKSGGTTNPWRALEILKKPQKSGRDNLYKRPLTANSGRESSPASPLDLRPWVDKSKCKASNCTTCIKGKNATNLMNHLVSKHKELAAAVEKRGSTCAGSVVSTSFRSLCGARIFCLWGPDNGKEKG
jgi:hypothetical protein